MTLAQAIFLGALQGATELFPLSSLGLTAILPYFLGFGNVTSNPQFLPFVVALHLGTIVALLAALAPEWLEVVGSILPGEPTPQRTEGRRILLMLVVASIPVGILGLLLQKKIQALFSAPLLAGVFLVVNGLIMIFGELSRRQPVREADERSLGRLDFRDAVNMGLGQVLALLPGISRSGSTMTAGILSGLSREGSARFTFLMAVPAIGAASLLELRHLHFGGGGLLLSALAGGVVAAIIAYLSAKYLLRYFGNRGNLYPFAFISMAIGLLAVAVIGFKL